MSLLRSERFPAVLLLGAAVVGLAVANSPLSDAALAVQDAHIGIPGTPFDLSVGHWISDGLLAFFFFIVAVELRYELTRGELRTPRRAVQPAIAAAGGVIVPVAVYLAFTFGSGVEQGWPIPTATDIAFALGVLAMFGRGLPSGVRVFLLALAILDDVVGIVLIAVLFADDVDLAWFALAVAVVAVFGALSRFAGGRLRVLVGVTMALLALAAWCLVLASGVHATIAGVLLGLAIANRPGMAVRHAIEPWINGIVLPLFAFSAALVPIPAISPAQLSPAFWGILVALPVGKVVGIMGAGWIAQRLLHLEGHPRLASGDLLAAGALGGIGFTVSLLLAQLAFEDDQALVDEATLGVLAGSIVAIVLSAVLVAWRARHHRRIAAARR